MKFLFLSWTLLVPVFFQGQEEPVQIAQWTTHEIILTSLESYGNPYTEVDVWATFTNQKGDTLLRPSFWDGGNTWKIRFSPPDSDGEWQWISTASNESDKGLHRQSGVFRSLPYKGDNELIKNGLLRMSAGFRNVVHQSGKSFLVVADTPWAIPFRATKEQVEVYAKDRHRKGFNAALMMTLQPDMNAEGPDGRNIEQGFKRAFNDLSDGHINEMNIDYFQYYDSLVDILLDHEIVPVFQPVFHGFGWKGLQVLGTKVEAEEYVRYTKYLLARYGSRPAFWLISGDHDGNDPGIKESGEMLQQWDCYGQPVGLHYSPCDDYVAEWAKNDPTKHCMHYNKTHQDEDWLDFQWAQTGHGGEHQYHKVARMYDYLPTKAVANGEPTYEGMNAGQNGLGWWQGEEAWSQLMHGGTMGVVYGAASLWQWKISPNEEGWQAWTDQPLSWEGAMQLEGATYVGLVGQILKDVNMTDIQKRWDLANGQPLLAKEGELYLSFLETGGEITILNIPTTLNYHWIDPKTGNPKQIGKVNGNTFTAPDKNPWVLLIMN
ncbi:DUF4038 domain-containing protein [Flavobacteriaceae bacterium TP-CH-4]|uniref:DUF4038 domain-containing protein n=1 Tax=Pelagihabitans pacificus TaxID=2696054 RepID=A0A967ATY2_9FLAO|nr:DUF4038 domain-containing protein [Pelagihabitans pacificus]NHF58948.1 DUF4038 domain-containing protein [Pelagihabitans pacificus]